MIISEVEGNLIERFKEGRYWGIAHGCNCFNTMGSGIALQIKKEFPEAFEADQKTVKGDKNKLGSFSIAHIYPYGCILNMYIQFNYGRKKANVDYDAIRECFESLSLKFGPDEAYHCNRLFGIPLIGCGLAGGDWNIVSEIIDEATPNLKIELVRYKV